MQLDRVVIGVSEDLHAPGEAFSAIGLHVYGSEPVAANELWRTPVRWIGRPGVYRFGSVAVAWGPAVDVAALVSEDPAPAVVVVSPDPRPLHGPLNAPHVFWVETYPGQVERIEVDTYPERSAEFALYDLTDGASSR